MITHLLTPGWLHDNPPADPKVGYMITHLLTPGWLHDNPPADPMVGYMITHLLTPGWLHDQRPGGAEAGAAEGQVLGRHHSSPATIHQGNTNHRMVINYTYFRCGYENNLVSFWTYIIFLEIMFLD